MMTRAMQGIAETLPGNAPACLHTGEAGSCNP